MNKNNSARHGGGSSGHANNVVEQAKFIQQFSKMSVTQNNNGATTASSVTNADNNGMPSNMIAGS